MGKKHKQTGSKKLSVNMKKSRARRLVKFSVSGKVTIRGRPDWPTRIKNIQVNQIASKGEIEDRRHLIHWDEQLKPLLDRVLTAMKAAYPADLYEQLKAPLVDRGWKRLAADRAGLVARIVTEINGAEANLVADRADINKAIEHVRANLRQYAAALQSDTDYAEEVSMRPMNSNLAKMARYQKMAETFLPIGRTATPITSRITEIHEMILENIKGCTSPSGLWVLVHELTYSVTFDLSAKASRDKTRAMLAWQSTMANNFSAPALQQYTDLLSILD